MHWKVERLSLNFAVSTRQCVNQLETPQRLHQRICSVKRIPPHFIETTKEREEREEERERREMLIYVEEQRANKSKYRMGWNWTASGHAVASKPSAAGHSQHHLRIQNTKYCELLVLGLISSPAVHHLDDST